jgi:DNA topoisomerase-6 subunit B
METISADDIFKEFREHSITEFFRKNRQMLGYSGKVRSLTTIVHEYVTNSLDACEEANILPSIRVEVKEIGEDRYNIKVRDNGPGIPKSMVGKALGSILTGTKFHRYMQQRGQQGIGAAGCTLFAQITTGKPVHVKANTGREAYEADISVDIKTNKPIISNSTTLTPEHNTFFEVSIEAADIKYENSEHGVYEYLKRTAIANPHVEISLLEPDGKESIFPRSSEVIPKKPKEIKPHPLGLEASDLLDFARTSENRKISSFLVETFSRVTQDKVAELKKIASDIDFSKDPREMTWSEAESLVKAFKQLKWIAPDLDSLSTIGEERIAAAIRNILNPKFEKVIERKPKIFRGGIPFVVEVGIAFGGDAGKKGEAGTGGTIMRFANRVPLLFDSANCAITEAVKGIQWKRYGIGDFDQEPVSVFVNVSSVYVPYAGVGKQAIADEEEIVEEIKLAVMDAARGMQAYISNTRSRELQESKYKTIMRYADQLSTDLGELTGIEKSKIEKELKALIESKYKKLFEENDVEAAQAQG